MLEALTRIGCFVAGALLLCLLSTIQQLIVYGALIWYGYIGPALLGGLCGVFFRHWDLQRRRTVARYANLEMVLQTLRTLNSLRVEVREQDEFLQKICENLVRNRRYHNAWIALFDGEGGFSGGAETGLAGDLGPLLARKLAGGWRPACVARVLAGSDPVLVTHEPDVQCGDCPLAPRQRGFAGMVARLQMDGRVYGVLCISVSEQTGNDQEEVKFFREIARDVGQALHYRELEAEQLQAEEAMCRQMQELFAIFNAIEGAVYVADMATHEILAITAGDRQLGKELHGRKCYEYLQKGQDGPCPFCTNARLVGPDGRPNPPVVWEFQNTRSGNWYLCIDRAIHWPDGRLVRMEIALNITDRKRAEESFRRSEKSLRELVDNSLVGIMLIQEGEIIYQNPEQRRLFGTLPRGYRLEDFEGVHPEDLPRLKESYRQMVQGEVGQVDVDFRYFPTRSRDGGEEKSMRWVYCRARPIDYQGRKTLLVSMMDMTHARELERLVQMQDKMSSLGRVAAGIAHEIRNPLSGINIYLNTLEKIHHLPDRAATVKEIFQQLYAASSRIESVIRRVMDFARPSQAKFVVQDVNGPVQDVLQLCSVMSMRKGNVILEGDLAPDLPHCRLDSHLIAQVVMNLITNSIEAMQNMEGPRRIRVRTERAGRHVLVKVGDSGPGVPKALRERIFDPFYTTKGDGTGIGLSVSHRIVTDHGGRLTALASELGGAEFIMALPIAEEGEAA